jgi:DNA-binding response OmpR family regulator
MPRICTCKTPTVLIVDDDRQICDTLADLLSEEGYLVATANSAQRAIAYLRKTHACMVLLDLMMPHKSGWAMLSELLGDPELPRVPVGVISALATETPLGAVGVLHKPLDIDHLLTLVHAHAGVPQPAAASLLRR